MLYFNKLIEKKIIFIKDLKFVNGILDETYIYILDYGVYKLPDGGISTEKCIIEL